MQNIAPSNSSDSLLSTYKKHEREKRIGYEHRIQEIEHGTFTPIVLSFTGGWGLSASVMYKRWAFQIADKKDYLATLQHLYRGK